jgi:hypothetical protein
MLLSVVKLDCSCSIKNGVSSGLVGAVDCGVQCAGVVRTACRALSERLSGIGVFP